VMMRFGGVISADKPDVQPRHLEPIFYSRPRSSLTATECLFGFPATFRVRQAPAAT
jgi:hypothetical protein